MSSEDGVVFSNSPLAHYLQQVSINAGGVAIEPSDRDRAGAPNTEYPLELY